MSKIYISDEALSQYKRYIGDDVHAKKLMEGFRKDRKSNTNSKWQIETRRRQIDILSSHGARRKIKKFLRQTKQSLKISKTLEVSNELPRNKKRALQVAQPIVFAHAPQLSKRTTKNLAKSRRRERALIVTKSNDMYNFASEYDARNIEFGHGRKKSLEWDQESVTKLCEELKRLRGLHKTDPNLFDREAIK